MVSAESGVATNDDEKRDDNPAQLVPVPSDTDLMLLLKIPADQKHGYVDETVRDDLPPHASLELT